MTNDLIITEQIPTILITVPPILPILAICKSKVLIIEKQPLVQGNLYNILDDLNELKSDITIAQLLDIASTVQKQLSQTKHGCPNDPDTMDISTIQLTEPTAAYSTGSIQGKELIILFNSGTACSCIDKQYLDATGLIIDAPATTTLILGDTRKAVPLGIIYDIPINIRPITILTDAIIVEHLSYPVILRTPWLKKARASLKFDNDILKVIWKTIKYKIPITVIKPAQETPIEIVEKQVKFITNDPDESKEIFDEEMDEEEENEHQELLNLYKNDDINEEVDKPNDHVTDLLQVDVQTTVQRIISQIDGDNYIISLPQLTTISANTDLIITIVPPNDIDDFFFDPWGHKLKEDEATTAVTFN